jgi:CHAT domain-containing protein
MTHADIIHFATHALAYAYYSKARASFLALAPDSTHDGLLTVGKLMDDSTLSVPATLIVLSGCQTALGSVMQAEGTVGLQRAFLAKGARALLVSLWSVDDEATEILMKSFYNHWLGDGDGPTKAEALQRAQQDIRKAARFAHPLYWAAFQLVGAN